MPVVGTPSPKTPSPAEPGPEPPMPAPTPNPSPPGLPSGLVRGILAAVLVVGALMLIVGPQRGRWSSNEAPLPPPESTRPKVGQEITLYRTGHEDVSLGKDIDAHLEARQFLKAGDAVGLHNLRASGRTFAVPNGTRALLVSQAIWSSAVRIRGGEHDGRLGWVSDDCITVAP